MSQLAPAERVEADDGYLGEAPLHVKCRMSFTNPEITEAMQAIVRMRQESVNKRFKDWGVLRQRYRHNVAEHGDAFTSVAVLTQLSINSGERLFPVGYRDPPYEPYVNQVFDVPSDDEDEFDDDQSL
jgi:hypothetical protein